MTSTSTLTDSADELRFRLHGGLHEPGDSYYEDSRTLFNTMINRRPQYVAECLAVVMEEEGEHHRVAVRDLAKLAA